MAHDHQAAMGELGPQRLIHQHTLDAVAVAEAIGNLALTLDFVRLDDLVGLGA
jgi:hypothetical protein